MVNADILVAGETLCDFFPMDDRGLLGKNFVRRPGGAPANVAVGLARLDCHPAVWTSVGDDPFGNDLVETLAHAGCQTSLIRRSDRPTTLAMVDPPADDFVFYRGADTDLVPGDIPEAAVSAANWLVIGGVSLSVDPARQAILALLDHAVRSDSSVFFDPNYRQELWDDFDFVSTVNGVLGQVDILAVTEAELALLAPQKPSVSARVAEMLDRGPHTVCVTAGAAGARLFSDQQAQWGPVEVSHAGYDVDTVDTVGAGDAFNAGILWALASGRSNPERILAAGNAVAALSTTALGAMNGLPTQRDLLGFLSARSTDVP